MRFFIDTANIEQIKEAQSLGILDGVTTNPSLMAKENIVGEENIYNHYKKICELVEGEVSAEVISTDYNGMISEAEKLSYLHPNIVVKIPCTKEGIKAIRTLSKMEIATNCTLVFSLGQAILAAKAGATFVSPFIGRIDDISGDGVSLVAKIVAVYNYYGYQSQVIAASIRHARHIIQCAEVGADIVTCPLNAMLGLLKHPLTDIGLKKFLDDYDRISKGK